VPKSIFGFAHILNTAFSESTKSKMNKLSVCKKKRIYSEYCSKRFLFIEKIYYKLNIILESLKTWAKKHKKLITLRKFYNILRFLIISYQLYLRKNKKLIIIGCGRSGTKFTSHLFKEIGLRIGHEKLEKHGISSWCLVPDTHKMLWGPSFKLLGYLKMPIIHQVRHPLDVISSVRTVFSNDRSWEFIREFIPINRDESLTLRCMKYWYFWNLKAENKSIFTYRVENIESELKKILEIGKFDGNYNISEVSRKISKKVNSRQHNNLSWKELKIVDERLTSKIIDLAKRYGYEIKF
jgi:hypothetical protein